jgi:hypothetical protein
MSWCSQPAIKWGPQSHNHEDLNSAKNPSKLSGKSLARHTLISVSWDPRQVTPSRLERPLLSRALW